MRPPTRRPAVRGHVQVGQGFLQDAAAPGAGGEPPRAGHAEAVEWRFRGGQLHTGAAELAAEWPVAFEYNGISHAVMLATPLDLEDFALGFSLGEGIVVAPGEIYGVEAAAGAEGITLSIEVAARAFAQLKERRRTLVGRTGCGICGADSLHQVLRPLPPVSAPGLRLPAAALARASAGLAARQPLQAATGAAHGAAWCGLDGEVLAVREDVGRHNALDKLVGALAQARVDTARGFALVTSRASVEMVQKAAGCGMPVLAAVSAPTLLAVQVAQAAGLTLLGFVRGADFSIYTHPQRIEAGGTGPTRS